MRYTLLSAASLLLSDLAFALAQDSHGHQMAIRHRRHAPRIHKRANATSSTCQSRVAASTNNNSTTASNSTTVNLKSSKGKKNCFPYSASFHGSQTKPKMKRSQWWCSDDKATGFLGFSLPLEATDCSDPSNSVATLKSQFSAMKKNYGAKYVRIYAPQCNDQTIWANLIEAGAATDMAVIPMIWWGFGSDPESDRKVRQAAMLAEIKSNPLAPYVFHSIAFGSEPIGDGVDGGIEHFTTDFIAFKAEVKPYGIPVAISEDWYRQGTLINSDLSLTSDGQKLMDAMDLVHAHVMPYYAGGDSQFPSPSGGSAWPYVNNRVTSFYPKISGGKKVFVTEMQWGSTCSPHGRDIGCQGVSVSDEQAFWTNNAAKSHCSAWKSSKTGYFFHVWNDNSGENQFGLLDMNNKPKFAFKPAC